MNFKQIIEQFHEFEISNLKNEFKNANDENKFKAVCDILKQRDRFNILISNGFGKSESLAKKCLEESEQLLKANKPHCALKKLNEALARAEEENLAQQIVAQRLLVLKRLGAEKIKCAPREKSEEGPRNNLFGVASLYRGRNERVGAFSKSVKLEHSQNFGRHFLAAEVLEPGWWIIFFFIQRQFYF